MASKRVKIVILSKKQIVISKVIKAKRLKFFAVDLGFFLFCNGNWKRDPFPVGIGPGAFMTLEITICFLD